MRNLMMVGALALIAAPLQGQQTQFSPQMDRGDRLEIENINGSISVVQGTGRTAEIVVTKTVKSGNRRPGEGDHGAGIWIRPSLHHLPQPRSKSDHLPG